MPSQASGSPAASPATRSALLAAFAVLGGFAGFGAAHLFGQVFSVGNRSFGGPQLSDGPLGFIFGSGLFWLIGAAIAGAPYGLLGSRAGRSKPVVTLIALGLPFTAEPWFWMAIQHRFPRPLSIWATESVLGMAALAAAVAVTWCGAAGRGRRPDTLEQEPAAPA